MAIQTGENPLGVETEERIGCHGIRISHLVKCAISIPLAVFFHVPINLSQVSSKGGAVDGIRRIVAVCAEGVEVSQV
jgi:hypothetical protein